jgi:hypothetical protein
VRGEIPVMARDILKGHYPRWYKSHIRFPAGHLELAYSIVGVAYDLEIEDLPSLSGRPVSG